MKRVPFLFVIAIAGSDDFMIIETFTGGFVSVLSGIPIVSMTGLVNP